MLNIEISLTWELLTVVCARLVTQVCLTLYDSFLRPWDFPGFSRQEYWSGLPSPPPGNLPDPGIKPMSLVIPALTGGFFTTEPAGKPNVVLDNFYLCLPKNPL